VRRTTRFARLQAIGFLIAFSLTPSAASPNGTAETRSTASFDLSRIDIDNFGRVNDQYYRGARLDEDDYAFLAAAGIKTLIDLTDEDANPREQALAAQAGLNYVHIPMTTHKAPTPAQLTEFLQTVNDAAKQPVYVHCVGGRHRTGVMTAVYRMTHDGWAADRAFKEMKQFKFGADFLHREFKNFVYSYSATIAHATVVSGEK
jgi:uncharacterized protein (TIGR01244 family)